MPNIICYLRTRRREWSLTQEELASLLPGCYRGRISDVERGKRHPKASELLAYGFIFDAAPENLFPAYAEQVQDAIMARACALSQILETDASPKGRRKAELLQNMLDRVTSLTPTL